MALDRTVALVTLGGTIACEPHPDGGVAPSTQPAHMEHVIAAALRPLANLPVVRTIEVPPLLSAALEAASIAALVPTLGRAIDEGACGVVITTGTDTLEEVAFLLDLLWDRPEPLVVVGAMRHEGLPGGDGSANLRDALRVAAHRQAIGMGCLVTLHGQVHQSWQVQKRHTTSLSAFESVVSGPVGAIFEDTVRMVAPSVIDRPLFTLDPTTIVPPVALLTASLADDGRLLREIEALGYRGLVIETMGGGSVPPPWSTLIRSLAATMPVVYSSRTGRGPTLRSTYAGIGTERDLRAMGVLPAGLLDGLKARLLLGLLLAAGANRRSMEQAFGLFDSPTTGDHRPTFHARAH